MSSLSRTMPENVSPVIILGADTVLAAQPASPVQLVHACQALGFELAAPASWGDELIAEGCLDRLGTYEHPAAIMCSCPHVTDRLTRSSTLLEPYTMTFVSPPVATARYLRAAFSGQPLHITYAGACPGADDPAIDARLLPAELFAALGEAGIDVGAQPQCFDALVPLDRRRFYSLPGGAPSRDQVEHLARRTLVELHGDDVVIELSQHLIEKAPVLLDVASSLGCACAGAGAAGSNGSARAMLLALEPPRARRAVLDPSLRVSVAPTAPDAAEQPIEPIESYAAMDTRLEMDEPTVAAPARPSETQREPCAPKPAAARPRPSATVKRGTPPSLVTRSGRALPRASLLSMQRALLRAASRNARRRSRSERTARRDPKVERTEMADRAIPRPLPPPPARSRARAVRGFETI
jgi:hypothetical protein